MPSSVPAGSRLPASSRPHALARPTDSDLARPPPKSHLRRRIRNPALPGARARRGSSAATAYPTGGRRSGPNTPLLRWKFNERPQPEPCRKVEDVDDEDAAPSAAPPVRVSARKLASGIWHLRPLEAGVGGREGGGRRARAGLENVHGHLGVQLLHNPLAADNHAHKTKKNDLASPVSVLSPLNCDIHQAKHFAGLPSSVMEKATKWDPESSMTPEEVYRFYSHLKLLDHREVETFSVVSSLLSKLEQSRSHINELETDRQSTKKKLGHFLKRLSEEKEAWKRREREKVRSVIDGLKEDLNREKKIRHRTEIISSKLVNELAEAKLSVKRLSQDYEKERKTRELLQEVCDELAKEIGEDKAEIEALKMEALKIREEVEEEKRMLQMAEVWREERVQMKLIDAKVTLEEKYSQLTKLRAELEAFLGDLRNVGSDAASIIEAELLKEKAMSLKVENIKAFNYQPPPASEDIYAVFEELQPKQEATERAIDPCVGYSPRSYVSKNNMASPATDIFLEPPGKQCANELMDSNEDIDEDSDWETISHAEEQGSSNSPEGSEPSVNGYFKESNTAVNMLEWENNGNIDLDNEIVEVSPMNKKQIGKKGFSISQISRSSAQDNLEDKKRTSTQSKNGRFFDGRLSTGTLASNNGEDHKNVSIEITDGRPSNGLISNGSISPEIGIAEVGFSPGSIQWSSPDSMNPRINRGLKGCIDWSLNVQKHSLKAKLMEARMESQKVQLRHVLKQKI